MVSPLMETGNRVVGGRLWRGGEGKEESSSPGPASAAASKAATSQIRDLVFSLCFLNSTLYCPNTMGKTPRKRDKCAPHPRHSHLNFLCFVQIHLPCSGSQPGAAAPSGGKWKRAVEFFSCLPARNLVGQGQGC